MGPSATTLPFSITAKASATRRAKGSFCSTNRMVRFSSRLSRSRISPILLDDIGLDALGWLIQNQQLRVQDQGAADGQLLLLSAGQVSALASEHLFEHRKETEHRLGDSPDRITPRRKTDTQVLLNRQLRKESRGPGEHSRCRGAPAAQPGGAPARCSRTGGCRRRWAGCP